jgi:hypothetical protein
MLMTIDVLIYVEDPGAVNYVADLPAVLAGHGWRTCMMAEGYACQYLLQRGIQPAMVDHSITADEILNQLKPRLVCVGTSENQVTFGFDLAAAAKRQGIVTVGVVDAFGNADYRFRGNTDNPLAYATEWLAVPDQWTKEAYIILGFPPERIAVCGHPHYDHVLDIAARLMKEDKRKLRKRMFPLNQADEPVVVFVSELSTGLNPCKYSRSQDYTLNGRGKLTGRTEIVIEEFLDALGDLRSRPYLVLRMHPKNTKEELASFLGDFHQVSQSESPLDLVYASDLVVGMTTMLLVEAAIMGCQTLSIVPRSEERRSLPTVAAGITPCVKTRETLRAILPDLLAKGRHEEGVENKPFFERGSLQKTVVFLQGLLAGDLH